MKTFQKATLFAALVLMAVPAFAEETDYTSAIVNPSFETNGLEGWTSDGFQSQTNNSPSNVGWKKDGNVYAEKWTSSPGHLDDASLSQVVKDLPNGDYVVRAVGHSINQSGTPATTKGTYLYTLINETPVNVADEYEVIGTVAEGTLLIGYKTVSTDANWVAIDNFRIYRTGESLENYKTYLKVVVEDLTLLFNEEQKPPTYNKEEIDAALAKAASANTSTDIFDALAALREAEKNYNAAKKAYKEERWAWDRMESEIRIAELFYDDSDYAGKSAFRTAIDNAKAVYDNPANGPEQFDAAIAALRTASATYKANRPEEWVRIKNGMMWKDIDGKPVQAHAAGFVLLNDRYYMIGEDRSNSWNPDVNMYSSKDLVNWRFERKIIKNNVTHPNLGSSRMIERPKLMYNAKTGKFVVWCHWEASNYGASEAGVFYSDVINAPYTYYSGERPLGVKSRDCNVYIDDDGTAYFISTTSENTNLGLFRLSDDYLEPVEHTVLFSGQRREAPAIVKHEGKYYMLSSACSGWAPNACKLSYTTDLTSGWTSLRQVGNPIAYDTQAAQILKIEGSKATTYLYVGDRWQDPDLPESKTIIFPISFTESNCVFEYVPEFEINFVTGEWRAVENPDRLDKTGWTILDFSSEETSKGSNGAANILDGDTKTFWHTNYSDDPGAAPHHIAVDMGKTVTISGFMGVPRNDTGSTNGLIREYVFQVSTDGENWTTVSAGSWMPYWSEVHFKPVEARYFKLISLSGTYASLAEIEIYRNTPDYDDVKVQMYYKAGNGSWLTNSNITIEAGKDLTFGPSVSGLNGSWAFECPDNSYLPGREVTIENIPMSGAGRYRAYFCDMYNNSHYADYQVTVKPGAAVEEIGSGKTVTSREYFTLGGISVSEESLAPGLYICREHLSDGTVRSRKMIVR